MICFGIDPGSRRTGWGVIRVVGNRMTYLEADVIAAGDGALASRVREIFEGLSIAIAAHQPDHVFIESIFHHKNARSALVLGHARGVALLAAQRANHEICEVSPAEVKKAVTGSGRADKTQVQDMVRVLLGLRERAPEDASDALAVAIAGSTRARSPVFDQLGRRA